MARCMQCGKELTHNEIGAHRKFINRGAEQFFCKQCLAEHLGVTPERIDEKLNFLSARGARCLSDTVMNISNAQSRISVKSEIRLCYFLFILAPDPHR